MNNVDVASPNGEESQSDSEAAATPLTNSRVFTERIVIGNSTKPQALMINGAVGEDLWKDVDRLEIRNNHAEDASTMVNHAISFEVLKWMMQYQDTKREQDRRYNRGAATVGTQSSSSSRS